MSFAEEIPTKFPSLLASSLLCLSFKACSEKSPSSPKGVSLNKKYLAASTPAIPINSSRDLILDSIFGCEYTIFGVGTTVLTIVMILYILVGGMRSVALADVAQGALLLVGMLIVLILEIRMEM